jgi:hypothetical protein
MVTIMATTYIWRTMRSSLTTYPGGTGSIALDDRGAEERQPDIHQYANQSDLENAPIAEISGFVPQTNTLILNVASSLWAPFVMPVAYEKAAKQQGVKLHAKALNTLPPQDPEGVVPGIALFVLLIGGYLGATFAMLRTKRAAEHRRIAALFGYSVVVALVIDLIAGPILDAYPDVGATSGSLAGVALICFAVARWPQRCRAWWPLAR